MDNQKFIYKNQHWVFEDYNLTNEMPLYKSILKMQNKRSTWNFIAFNLIISCGLYALLGNGNNLSNHIFGCLSSGTLISFAFSSYIDSIFSPITKKLKISKNINKKTEQLCNHTAQLLSEQKFQYSFLIYLEELEKNLDKYHFHVPLLYRQVLEKLSDLRQLQQSLIGYFSQEQFEEAAQLLVKNKGITVIENIFTCLGKINEKTAIEKEKLKINSELNNEMKVKFESYKNSLNKFKNSHLNNDEIGLEQEVEYKKYL